MHFRPTAAPAIDSSPQSDGRKSVFVAVAIFCVLSLYCSIRSEGFISADACTHYMAARYAFQYPLNFVDVWNRPLVTALFALPAQLHGRLAVRVVCMLIAAGCGVLGYMIAHGQGSRRPILALIFTLGQPLLFLHSFGEMTELPFALVLGGAFLAWQGKRYWLAAALVAWTPLARPEGFGFILIAALALVLSRKGWQLVLLPIPILLWDYAGWVISHHSHPLWRWLPDSWPYSQQSAYGRGYLLTFVALMAAVVSPVVLPATIIGIWRSLFNSSAPSNESGGPPIDDARSIRLNIFLTAALPLFVLIVHSLLYWLGKMASFGEARYLLVAAPFWGVLAARGWESIFSRMQWRHSVRWAAGAVFVPAVINIFHPVVPVGLSHDWESARQMARWYQDYSSAHDHPRVIASHPGIFYFLDQNPHDSPDLGLGSLRNALPGTLLMWDPIFSETNASSENTLTLVDIRKANWKELAAPNPYELNPDSVRAVVRDPNDPASHWHVFVRLP